MRREKYGERKKMEKVRKRRMKRIRAAADVSQVEKWEAQLGASGGINIQKRRTREGGAVRRSNNVFIRPKSDHCLALSLNHSVLFFNFAEFVGFL